MYVYETIETEHITAQMILDEDAQNPRKEYDNVGTILSWSRNYNLGDVELNREYVGDLRLTILENTDIPVTCRYCGEPITGEDFDYGEFVHESRLDEVDDVSDLKDEDLFCNRNPIEPDMSKIVAFGLDHREYDGHLSVVEWDDINPIEFCRIDGVIFCTQETVMEEWGSSDDPIEMAENYLRGEIREYSEYLQGNVYGIIVTNNHTGKELDACWVYVGTEYAESMLKEEAESWDKSVADDIATEEASAQIPVLLTS